MRDKCEEGDFLVRRVEDSEWAVSLRQPGGAVAHYRILYLANKGFCAVDSIDSHMYFPSLDHLVKHYRDDPIETTEAGESVVLHRGVGTSGLPVGAHGGFVRILSQVDRHHGADSSC